MTRAVNSFLNNNLNKKIIIIDHSPSDELRKVCNQSELEYFHHPENKGFGAGHNIAIKKIIDDSPYHLVLNPDVYFDSDIVRHIIKYIDENQNVAHLMPRVLNQNGDLQYLAKLLPSPIDLFAKRFLPKSISDKRLYKFQLRFADYNSIMNVPYLSGCCMFLKTVALKEVGLFDERFFMYPEDIDLTRRLHSRYKTIYYPHVSVIHKHEASSYKDKKMLKVHVINMIRYFNKWGWVIDAERSRMNKEVLKELNYFRPK